jgi:hypothetical protein
VNTQSIIVYRNPLEQQFWESGMLFPIMIFMIVFIATFLATHKIQEMIFGSWKVYTEKWPVWINTVAGLVAVALAIWML